MNIKLEVTVIYSPMFPTFLLAVNELKATCRSNGCKQIGQELLFQIDNPTAQAKKQETKKRRIVEQVNFGGHLEDGSKENLEPADQNPGGFSFKETVAAKSSNKTGERICNFFLLKTILKW